MNILLDENVPAPLGPLLAPHMVTTVPALGWSGIQNGALLELAEGRFDVLILADKNLRYQQNLTGRKIALVELPTNRWTLLLPLLARIVETLDQVQPGSYTLVVP